MYQESETSVPAKFYFRVTTGIARLASRPLSVARVFGFFLTVTALVFIGIVPTMQQPGQNWTNTSSWQLAFLASWPALFGAFYLKYSEKAKRIKQFSKTQLTSWTDRRMLMAKVLVELPDMRDALLANSDTERVRRVRTSILECVAASVRTELGIPEDEYLHATLMDFMGDKLNKGSSKTLKVAASSNKTRDLGSEHLYRKRCFAGCAIEAEGPIIEHNVRKSRYWHSLDKKEYKSVAARSIVYNDKVYGVICVESEKAYAFLGRSNKLDVIFQPYLSALQLTYPQDSTIFPLDD